MFILVRNIILSNYQQFRIKRNLNNANERKQSQRFLELMLMSRSLSRA